MGDLVIQIFDTLGLSDWYEYFIVNSSGVAINFYDFISGCIPFAVAIGIGLLIINWTFSLFLSFFNRGRF